MQMVLSRQEWEALEHAQRQERGVRNWRRYQAIRLLAQGEDPAEVAEGWAVACRVCTTGSRPGSEGATPGCMKITTGATRGCWPLQGRRAGDAAHHRSARARGTSHGVDRAAAADPSESGGLCGERAYATADLAPAGLALEAAAL